MSTYTPAEYQACCDEHGFKCAYCGVRFDGAGEVCESCDASGAPCTICGARKDGHLGPGLVCPDSQASDREEQKTARADSQPDFDLDAALASIPDAQRMKEHRDWRERLGRAPGGRIDHGPGSFTQLSPQGIVYHEELQRLGATSTNLVRVWLYPDGRQTIETEADETRPGSAFHETTTEVAESDLHHIESETVMHTERYSAQSQNLVDTAREELRLQREELARFRRELAPRRPSRDDSQDDD